MDKLRAQGWLELFTNTLLGCSQSDLVEFYANVYVSEGLLTSTVNGVLIEVDARALRVILGVPATGFDLYVREDKSLLGKANLLEFAQHLSQQPGLKQPQVVKKAVKNIIPRAQGRNQADAMDQCLTNLMDRGEQINLLAFMITHITRIANTLRAHDLGYGLLLTTVFEHFGVELKKKVDAQVIYEAGSSTITGCGFDLIRAGDPSDEQGVQTPHLPVLRPSPSQPAASAPLQEQQHLQDEITALKGAFQEEKELNLNVMRTS